MITQRSNSMRRSEVLKTIGLTLLLMWSVVVVASAQDTTGFTELLNGHRAAYGLPFVSSFPGGETIAVQNNVAQRAHGLGHWVTGNLWQCANMGCGDVPTTLASWLNSPPHRNIILNPALTAVAYANDGYYATVVCTMNQAAPVGTVCMGPPSTGAACYRRGLFGRVRHR